MDELIVCISVAIVCWELGTYTHTHSSNGITGLDGFFLKQWQMSMHEMTRFICERGVSMLQCCWWQLWRCHRHQHARIRLWNLGSPKAMKYCDSRRKWTEESASDVRVWHWRQTRAEKKTIDIAYCTWTCICLCKASISASFSDLCQKKL